MATLNKPYCTLAQLQEELGNDEADETSWFQECINRASRIIDAWCHRDFWYHDYSAADLTVKREWIIGDTIYLPWKVITLSSLTIDGTLEVAGEDYRYAVGSKKIVWAGEEWPQNKIEDWIVLRGTFGYAITDTETPPTDVPENIVLACIRIAAPLTGEKRKEFIDLAGVKQSLLDQMIPKEVKTLLSRHRRLVL